MALYKIEVFVPIAVSPQECYMHSKKLCRRSYISGGGTVKPQFLRKQESFNRVGALYKVGVFVPIAVPEFGTYMLRWVTSIQMAVNRVEQRWYMGRQRPENGICEIYPDRVDTT